MTTFFETLRHGIEFFLHKFRILAALRYPAGSWHTRGLVLYGIPVMFVPQGRKLLCVLLDKPNSAIKVVPRGRKLLCVLLDNALLGRA